MKEKLLILIALLISANAMGQEFIRELARNAIDTSIVRGWKEEQCVIFTADFGREDYYFHLINNQTGMARSIKVTECVKDMEIIEDTLFFCGRNIYDFPVVGFLNLNELNGLNVTITYIDQPIPYISTAKKMDIIRVSDGIHFFVVGDIGHGAGGLQKTFVADVSRYLNSTAWYIYYYDGYGKECFEDIVATDNYVAMTSHIDHTDNILLRLFERPTNAARHDFPPTPTHHNMFYNTSIYANTYFYSGTARHVVGGHGYYPITITHINNDKIALTHFAKFLSNGHYGLSIKTADIVAGTPNCLDEINADWGDYIDTKYNVQDIRYDRRTDSLTILATKKPVSCGFPKSLLITLDNLTLSTMYEYEPTVDMWTHSFDWYNPIRNSTISCGRVEYSGTKLTRFGINTPASASCFAPASIPITRSKFTLTDYPLVITPIWVKRNQQSYTATTIITSINEICHE